MELFKHTTNIDFLGLRKISVGVSIVLLIASLALLATRGLHFGLDFTGGTLVEVAYEQPVDIHDVRVALESGGYENPVVQGLGNSREVAIRIAPKEGTDAKGSQALAKEVLEALKKDGHAVTLKRSDFVGPQVGKELRTDGLVSVVVVALGIMLYIAARFEWRFGVAALVTEIHDTVLTVGFLSLIGHEFDLTVLAAVLSVVGYSINDKVVVFDRVREIFRSGRKMEPVEVLNRAINSTLSRTVITAFATGIAVAALWVIGSPVVAGFGLTMVVGIVIGTLSSIFFASPILLWLGVSKRDLMPKARDLSELNRRP